ncbi:hypothetical protein [Photobacterium aquimaris]|uniref:Uncharacterized protein n=1 Tax=Photobacterium aquimaris TaxID=512643 RepID=A0A2T3I0G6_9GAMM|nr:hypothetical protein [Photobacterium aquimaris]OBU25580.1 hypothetical protein AYY21_08340 [Photobacterium aquimaris]PQJ37121.1 hypothetical protein BTN98_18445 [Photobacterium aquimaris]PSU10023.1 hypothetical protein C0W81_04690 [Photobacterium aquimaris]
MINNETCLAAAISAAEVTRPLPLISKKHLIEYVGKMITTHKLCQQTNSDYRRVKRLMNAGVAAKNAVGKLIDKRVATTKTAKLSPSEMISIYVTLFRKENGQVMLATKFNVLLGKELIE